MILLHELVMSCIMYLFMIYLLIFDYFLNNTQLKYLKNKVDLTNSSNFMNKTYFIETNLYI